MDTAFFVETRPKGGYWKRCFQSKHRPDWEIVGSRHHLLEPVVRQAARYEKESKNAGYQYRVSLWVRVMEAADD